MCGPKVDTSYQDYNISEANRTRAEDDARKARIDEGMAQIAAIFEGGEYAPLTVMPSVVGENTDDKDYKNDVWKVSNPGTRGDATIYEGMQAILDQRDQAQRDFYLPQLDQSRDKAGDELTFALARAGLLDSTVAGSKQGELGEKYALERGSILSRIASDIAGTKTQMNQQRSALEAGLRASGDASQAAEAALTSAATFRQDQPTLDPLGHLLAGISEGIGAARTGAEVERIRGLARGTGTPKSAGRLVA